MQILSLHDSEILDHFVQRLKPSLFKQVIEQAPKTFEDTDHFAKRASLAQ